MYIGSTGVDGLHHLIKELLDNAVDEALAGYCDRIDLHIASDGAVSVSDNGRESRWTSIPKRGSLAWKQ